MYFLSRCMASSISLKKLLICIIGTAAWIFDGVHIWKWVVHKKSLTGWVEVFQGVTQSFALFGKIYDKDVALAYHLYSEDSSNAEASRHWNKIIPVFFCISFHFIFSFQIYFPITRYLCFWGFLFLRDPWIHC